MKLIFIDVETTGIECPAAGLIQLAGIVKIDGEEKQRFDLRIRPFPEDEIADEALAVNGVTKDQLDKYPDPGTVFHDFVELLDSFIDRYDRSDKFHLVAYNAKFDADHLRAWFQKNGDGYFGSWFWNPPLDVMDFAAFALMRRRSSLNNFKLATVAEALGLKFDEGSLHDALYDIELTRRLFHLLLDRVRNK